MIVVAIIGILSSVAVPAYTDYTQKARAGAALASATGWQTAVNLCWQVEGNLAACQFGSNGVPALPTNADDFPTGIEGVRNAGEGAFELDLTAREYGSSDSLTVRLTPVVKGNFLNWEINCSDYQASRSPVSRVSECVGGLGL
jgi:Tfp pilus assembly major pilin PilA